MEKGPPTLLLRNMGASVPLEQSVSYTAPPHTNMGHAGPAFAAP